MPIEYVPLWKAGVEIQQSFIDADKIAKDLRQILEQKHDDIRALNIPGGDGREIQEVFREEARTLGFEHERRGLFETYQVAGLRPDYYCPIGDTGILLEVERGRTIDNNMDLLDLWKCHICEHAKYLFLVVPQALRNNPGVFQSVQNRLGVFFERKNYVNVDAVHLFGY